MEHVTDNKQITIQYLQLDIVLEKQTTTYSCAAKSSVSYFVFSQKDQMTKKNVISSWKTDSFVCVCGGGGLPRLF